MSELSDQNSKPPSLTSKQFLAESEVSYQLMIDSVKDYAIFMLDPQGYISSWNSGAEKLKGYTKAEILHQHFSVFYTEQDIQRNHPAYVLQTAEKEGRFEDEGWRVKKDGSLFWANVVISLIYNEQKKIIGFSKVTRDLTERKALEDKLIEAKEELRESEERSRRLIETVKDYAIFLLTPEGRIATWNEGAKRIKGYEAEEIIGCHFSKFYPPEAIMAQYPQFELAKAMEDGRFEDEGWRIKKDGSMFWANVVITPVYDDQKQHIGFTKITRDLSERVRNEALMKKNIALHKINTDLDNFV
ncbi:PAS domain-containing protein [Catalinimonas niigatensis]|uniref:PAS domain-containing protein n=1 Tax=Catalinimonas niigatensis TaxID=1397264 RepID=UPI0026651454|nr:PAS domain-containing protein [Catalinimonas niigatensis]WPP50614.1 PAS domain-containing protein [Catalinimonas niigatensis]